MGTVKTCECSSCPFDSCSAVSTCVLPFWLMSYPFDLRTALSTHALPFQIAFYCFESRSGLLTRVLLIQLTIWLWNFAFLPLLSHHERNLSQIAFIKASCFTAHSYNAHHLLLICLCIWAFLLSGLHAPVHIRTCLLIDSSELHASSSLQSFVLGAFMNYELYMKTR